MSRIIGFSTKFPAYHPKKGIDTNFVEKIWTSLYGDPFHIKIFMPLEEQLYELNKHLPYDIFQRWRDTILNSKGKIFTPKYHTIRNGNKWKAGDKFKPAIWSGKPYYSKRIIIGPDIEVKKTWDLEIKKDEADEPSIYINKNFFSQIGAGDSIKLAENDGLTLEEMKDWFKYPKPFSGQIISWDSKIQY